MANLPTGKFLSLIPALHELAVILENPVVESTPASPTQKPVEPIVLVEKTRRSSSSASEVSLPGDVVGQIQKQQFLKLGH